MRIDILQQTEGAREARGLTVIIDVFRAFTTACYAFSRGASKIIPVGSAEEALLLKQSNPHWLLMGEVNERMPDGFDFGNSPTHIENYDFHGKTLVQRTSAGTQGIVNAIHASEIITGSFVNAGSIVDYIRLQSPSRLSLVCMGYGAHTPADEDTFCAELIRDRLLGVATNYPMMVDLLRQGSGQRLLDPANQEHSPARDFELCTQLDTFPFILRIGYEEEVQTLRCINL